MYRQNNMAQNDGYPPIPTMVEAEIHLDENGYGYDGRSSRISLLGQSTATGIGNVNRADIPPQLQRPDSLAYSVGVTSYADFEQTSRPTASLVRTKSSFLVEEQLTDLRGKSRFD